MTLQEAIANFEGFYGPSGTNLATRNNNPGDIIFGKFASSYGATVDPNSSFAIFPDVATGFNAITDLLSSPSYSNLTIEQAIARWNGNGSNTNNYVDYVTSQTGLSPNTLVSDALTNVASTVPVDSGTSPISDSSNGFDFSEDFSSFSWTPVILLTLGALALYLYE